MSIVKIENSILNGRVCIPPSKSAAHRALICSFLSGGGNVEGIIDSADMKATITALNALKNDESIIDCIESGSTLRFIIPIAAALGKSVCFTGSGRLPERPIGEYVRLLEEHGVSCKSNGYLPLEISGRLSGGTFELRGDISSQYVTGLLLALPLLKEDSKIVLTSALQSKPYVDMTIKVLKDYNINIIEKDNTYYISGNQSFKACDYTVEGDWSQSAFFLAAGAINGNVEVGAVDFASTQGDREIVDILERFGAKITRGNSSVTAEKSELSGIEIDAKNIPDLVPALAVVAARAKGKTIIKNAERLRLKESNRIESVVFNLKKMGVNAIETADGMIIEGNENINGAELCGFNDHRIVMAFSVLALVANGTTTITDAHSINKSYPSFFDDYNNLGGRANVICDR